MYNCAKALYFMQSLILIIVTIGQYYLFFAFGKTGSVILKGKCDKVIGSINSGVVDETKAICKNGTVEYQCITT